MKKKVPIQIESSSSPIIQHKLINNPKNVGKKISMATPSKVHI